MNILEVSRGLPCAKYPMNGIFEWDQAKALAGAGHKVFFAAIDLRSVLRVRKFGISHKIIEGIDVYEYSVPLGRVPSFLIKFFSWYCLRKIIKRISKKDKIDIVHFHFAETVIGSALKLKDKTGLDYIVTEHSSKVNADAVDKSVKQEIKKVYHCSKANIAVSPDFAETLRRLYDEKFVYIPNVVDLGVMGTVNRVEHNGYNFVSVGNLIPRKGMDVTIKAFKLFYRENPNSSLTIVGDGPQKENLEKLVRSENLSDCVTFCGRLTRDRIKEVFDKSDCFVLASKGETFGVVYIEAMAAGLPVIATKCGGPEGFVNDSNGVLVEINDVEKLADAMQEISLKSYNPDKLNRFCLENFAPEVIANKLTELINGVIVN